VEPKSPFERAKDLQSQLVRLVTAFDIDSLGKDERAVLLSLRRLAGDVRLDVRDYGMAETVTEQTKHGTAVQRSLKQLEVHVVQAGSLGLLGAADVAVLSATIQQLMSEL
jgi:hypothetical protein